MSDTEKKKYQLYQERYLKMYKKGTNLPEHATLTQVVCALADIGQFCEATELLFGGERAQLVNDQISFLIFMSFWTGNNTELLRQVAGNHTWSSSRPNRGFAIQIYPGEFFVIREPTATKVLRQFLNQ